MGLNIIVGMTRDRVIGLEGKLPWHIPQDLRNFKRITLNNTLVMGKNTYLSIGKALPQRNNIVVSSSLQPQKGIIVAKTIEEALGKAQSYDKEVFVIGGAQVYNQTIARANKMYISMIKKDYPGDTYFPEFNELEWKKEFIEDYLDFSLFLYTKP